MITSRWPLITIGALLIAALSSVIWLPPKIKQFTVFSTLQNKQAMQVSVRLKAAWPWSAPDRLIDFKVSIDGKEAHVPKEFFTNITPLDVTKKLLVSEWKGYPEIIMWGQTGSSLNEVHWWFLNDSFSELRIEQNRKWENTYHAEPADVPEIIKPLPPGSKVIAPASNPVPATAKDATPKKKKAQK
jgi:hypothetical protein